MQWNGAKALVGAEETPRHKQKSEERAAMTMSFVAQVHEHKHRVSAGKYEERRGSSQDHQLWKPNREGTSSQK